jgi:hypothetical protein
LKYEMESFRAFESAAAETDKKWQVLVTFF